MLRPLSNRGTETAAARNAEEIVGQCRLAVGDLLNADPDEVIFGRSMTSLTFDLSRTLAERWGPGDEIVVTRSTTTPTSDPGSSPPPRRARWCDGSTSTRRRASCRWRTSRQLSDRTRLVAVTAASNLIGTMPDVRAIAPRTHAAVPCSTSTACTTPRTASSTSATSAPTSSPARRTSSSGRTAAWSSGGATCWPNCDPTSCCPPPIGCRSASSSARCPTS